MKNSWKSYWENTEESFIEQQIQKYKAKYGYRKLLKAVPNFTQPGHILEVGAGKAWLSQLLRTEGWKTVALDLDPDIVRANFHKVNNYILGDVYKLPFKDKSFDVIISCGLVEHFDLNDVQKIVSEMFRVGKIVVAWFPSCGLAWKTLWSLRNMLGADVFSKTYEHSKENIKKIFVSNKAKNIKTGNVLFGGIFWYFYVYGTSNS